MKENKKILVVIGPTASGKSDFAVALALKNNGEIISADSRQIYKNLDLCTGKITQEEMKGVTHYMLDICNLSDEFSVSEYKDLALPILENIFSRGKTPILCGGTGQYVDSLIFDQEIPKVLPNKKLREELEKKETEELYKELTEKDERRAKEIDKHNRPRLIRALEIINSIGYVPQRTEERLRFPTKIFILNPDRKILRENITKRLEKRLEKGMIDEVTTISQKIHSLYSNEKIDHISKRFGLEYVAITKYLQGIIDKETMKQEIITKSMHYVKRQQTWNKKYTHLAEIMTTEIDKEKILGTLYRTS